jgi:hypothetical protein
MAWYSDEALEAFAIVVWSLAFVLFLVALALPCPLCRRDVRDWTTCYNKCVVSLLGLVFVSYLVTSDEGTLQSPSNPDILASSLGTTQESDSRNAFQRPSFSPNWSQVSTDRVQNTVFNQKVIVTDKSKTMCPLGPQKRENLCRMAARIIRGAGGRGREMSPSNPAILASS